MNDSSGNPGEVLRSVNPAKEATLDEFPKLDPGEIGRKVETAVAAFHSYRPRSPGARADRLQAVAKLLTDRKDRWARMITLEMGKTLPAAVAEVEKCAWVCRHFAESGGNFLADREIETEASKSLVRF